jgi:proline iminopeptidase
MQLVTIRDVKLFYDIGGSNDLHDGEPVLFVLPGGPGNSHDGYKKYSIEFEQFSHVVYIDPRGSGLSLECDPSTLTMENYIEDVEALRQHLCLDKIHLLGTSFGSMVALAYAVRYASHLKSLVLIAGAASYHFIDDAKKYLAESGTPEQQEIAEKLWNGSFNNEEEMIKFVKLMSPMYTTMTNNITLSEESTEVIYPNYIAINKAFSGFLPTFNILDQLNRVTSPTRIIVGSEDWINHPKHAEAMAKRIPNAELHILKGSGHFVSFDRHDEYIRLVDEFITSHNRGKGKE